MAPQQRNGNSRIPAQLSDRSYLDVKRVSDEIRAGVRQYSCERRIRDPEAASIRGNHRGQPAVPDFRLCSYGTRAIRRTRPVAHGIAPGRGRMAIHKALTHDTARHQPATTSEG